MVKQHNTFTRGVDIAEARKFYNFPSSMSDEEIADYVLTHPHVPTEMNSGGNPNRLSTLYTSNSLGLSKAYTGGENGYVGILQRPITWYPNRSDYLLKNDFRFNRSNSPLSATTDEPIILRKGERRLKNQRNKGMFARERRGKIVQKYTPVKPTGIDAQAHQGSSVIPTSLPDDPDFRHYLFYGKEDQPLLNLLYKFKSSEGLHSVDYDSHSIGFSKKKALGGKL